MINYSNREGLYHRLYNLRMAEWENEVETTSESL